ncbi:hypothetical protein HPMBJEAJ_00025 [Aeromonas phage avDM6]|nr:hypothetical protein HPMBJEAJ_00025 [Aeromonas phage avDM6]
MKAIIDVNNVQLQISKLSVKYHPSIVDVIMDIDPEICPALVIEHHEYKTIMKYIEMGKQ